LTAELTEVRMQAAHDKQEAEKSAAVASGRIKELEEEKDKLKQEREHLLHGVEMNKIEAAKAQLQVERADKAAIKAEKQVEELGAKLQQSQATHDADIRDKEKRIAEAEKQAAVAKQRSADQAEAQIIAEKRMGELTGEVSKLQQTIEGLHKKLEDQSADIQERGKRMAEAEKRCVALEAKTEAKAEAVTKAESRIQELITEVRELRQKEQSPRPTVVGVARNINK